MRLFYLLKTDSLQIKRKKVIFNKKNGVKMISINILAMSQSPDAQGGGLASMIPFVLIIGIIYFLMIRPQSKKAKQHAKMLAELKKGDRIVTIGGVYGSIVQVKEKTFIVKISASTDIEVLKSSVAEIVAETNQIESKTV
jgi:preprotein translocase subunit YajC